MHPRPGPCRHCDRPVAYDPQGTPIHTSREYACRDRWGQVTDTYAELPPAVGRASVPGAAHRATKGSSSSTMDARPSAEVTGPASEEH
jgi:hypothetical protein